MSDTWNGTDLVFKDISAEASREYTFPGGGQITIVNPTRLHVSASGGHRILTADGCGHYVPAGFIRITWKVKDGFPTFVA